MNFIPPDFSPASSEIFMLIMVCVVMLADLTVGENKRYLAYLLTQITLVGCALLTFLSFSTETTQTFSGMFVDDTMADILKLMVYGTVSAVLIYSHTYISDRGML
nr:NADH:ubiquinone oxidoreductase subunit N [Nitrosomonas sp.]